MTKPKPPEEHKPDGRPTKYEARFAKLCRAMALLGATDAEMADALNVAVSTFALWKTEHPKFSDALKQGKDEADARVAQSLYHRALGYSHPAVKIVTVPRGANQGSDIEQVEYIERYPPDTTAAIFWLKNRRKAQWRDKTDHEHELGPTTLEALLAASQKPPADQ